MAGKTSLLKQIKGLDFKKEESQTHGIIIEKLRFETLPLFKEHSRLAGVTGRFWDFGGQEIMHASHQFFLSSRSIYLLVLDSRTDAKKEEWLKHIEKFGRNSPTIIAINKIDENRNYDVERTTLNKKFPFLGNRFHKISCAQREGLSDLAKDLADLIPETEIFKTKFSPAWVAVKEQLEQETAANNYIDQQRFEAICAENNVQDKVQQKTLLNYLDNLGIALHFESLGLKNFYVLDPHWVTIGVYKIINSPSIEGGVFEESMLDHILNVENVKKTEYDPAKEKVVVYSDAEQQYLVKIMQEFELLFEYAKGKYLVPDLLPKEPTMAYSFDESGEEHIHFVLKYDFFPPTLMPRFIIRMKSDIPEITRLWRSGVELHPKSMDAQGIVKSDKSEKRIDICVCGNTMAKREYFAFILKVLRDIHSTYEKLEAKGWMPVPGHLGELVEYEELRGLEDMGEDELKIGKLGKKFSVSKDFLDKISTKQQRMEEKNKQGDTYNFHISGGNIGNLGGQQENVQQEVSQGVTTHRTPDVTSIKDQKMNKLYWFGGILLFLLLMFIVYNMFSSNKESSLKVGDKGGELTVKPSGAEKLKTANVIDAAQVTVIGSVKINNRLAKAEEIKKVYVKNQTLVKPTTLSGNTFKLESVNIPENGIVEIGFDIKGAALPSSEMFRLPKPDANGICELGEVLIEVSLPKPAKVGSGTAAAPTIVINNSNVVNNGGN